MALIAIIFFARQAFHTCYLSRFSLSGLAAYPFFCGKCYCVNRFVDLLISHLYKDYTRGISPTGEVIILAKCCRIHCTTSPYFRGSMLPFIQFQNLCPFVPTVRILRVMTFDVLPPVMTFYRHLIFSGKSPEAFFGSKYKGYYVTSHSVTTNGIYPDQKPFSTSYDTIIHR